MSTDQNKAVVRRFITEVLAGGNLAVVDQVLGPTYANRALGADLAGFKGFLPSLASGLPVRRFDIEELVAEGDAVVARFTMTMANANGQSAAFRCLTYYRLADGKIVEDEPITSPGLMETLDKLMPSSAQVAQP